MSAVTPGNAPIRRQLTPEEILRRQIRKPVAIDIDDKPGQIELLSDNELEARLQEGSRIHGQVLKQIHGEPMNKVGTARETVERVLKQGVVQPASVPVVKKKFVRKPYLTDRPFGNNVPLKELRDKLRAEQSAKKPFNKYSK